MTGNKNLVVETFYPYYSDLKQYFLSYTKNGMDAEDMVQDLFLKLLTLENVYIVGTTARSYVFTIAKRMIIDDARHRTFVIKASDGLARQQEARDSGNQHNSLVCKQIEDMEHAFVVSLPAKMRETYSLARYEDMDTAEISKTLGVASRTAESNLYQSRKRVREYMRRVVGERF